VAPSTTKLAPGSVWNTAASARSLTQSCAQASRARSEHGVTIERQRTSKRVPSSLRVSVPVREL
jgi:hypothetical protein